MPHESPLSHRRLGMGFILCLNLLPVCYAMPDGDASKIVVCILLFQKFSRGRRGTDEHT